MSKHTPGPWVYDLYTMPGGNRAHITTVAHCCEYVIGLPSSYPGGNYRDGDPSGYAEADARLIAAAPELLQALQEVSKVITIQDHLHPAYGWGEWLTTNILPAIRKATEGA